jgi:hypothetical protein
MTPSEARKRNDDDLVSILASPAGRRFFFRLLTQSGLYSSSYAPSATDTAYNEGRRSVALSLMREGQRVASELYAQALREQLDAEQDAPPVAPPAAE